LQIGARAALGGAPGTSIGGLLYDDVNIYLIATSIAGGPEDHRGVCDAVKSH